MEDVYENMSQELKGKNRYRRDRDAIFRDLITALGVCHNVTPVID